MENKWIPEPTGKGWWWMLYMGYAQEVSCKPVQVYMIEGIPCVGKGKKSGKFSWVATTEKYKDNSGFMVLGWQYLPEPDFNPNDY